MRSVLLLAILMIAGSVFGQAIFTDQSDLAGIDNTGQNRGVAIIDFDNDGWEDIYISRLNGANMLYRNLGDGSFQDVSQNSGIAQNSNTLTAVWGDLDNDGFADLVLGNKEEASLLYRNNGDGSFTDMTTTAGITTNARTQSANLADVNNDGLLDIYLANLDKQNALYLNKGDWIFEDITISSGAVDTKIAMGAVFVDYDNDNDQDLYLTHDGNQSYILYQNDGAGNFTDVSAAAGVDYEGQGMGVDVGDINNDGWMDMYITNLYENTLYLNNGDGTFSDISVQAGITDPGMGWGTAFLDYNNDGRSDIYVANETYFAVDGIKYDNVLYQNMTGNNFSVVSNNTILASPYGAYGAACADLNRDGQADLIIANSGENDGNQLFLNGGDNDNFWISMSLEGTTSNRSAIGARVTVKAAYLNLTDQINAGSGFASQNSLKLHFGLDDVPKVDELTIYWPSGLIETFTDVAINQHYRIVEGENLLTNNQEIAPLSGGQLAIFPNPNAGSFSLDLRLPEPVLEADLHILNAQGQLISKRQMNNLGLEQQISWDNASRLEPGYYWMELRTPFGRLVKSFVVQ